MGAEPAIRGTVWKKQYCWQENVGPDTLQLSLVRKGVHFAMLNLSGAVSDLRLVL